MGFSLAEMQAWDQRGRKPTRGEQINKVIGAIAQGMKQKEARDMARQTQELNMRKGGYTPQESTGLAGMLGKVLNRTPQYEYTGVPSTELDKAKIADYQAKAAGTGYYDQGTTSKDAMSQAKDMAYKLVGGSSMMGMDPQANQQYIQLVNAIYNQMISGQQGNLQLPQQQQQVQQPQAGNQQGQNWLGSLMQNMAGGSQQPAQRIRVRDKASGQTGTVPANEFDASKYERI